MQFFPGNSQHIGARSSQQDAFGYSDPEDAALVSHGGLVAVVADGMGGMANGRDAALCAIHTFLGTYAAKSRTESIPDALMRSLLSANAAVVRMAKELQVFGEMGTTLAAVALHETSYYSISVGDSAAFLMRGGRLYPLTASHTHGEDLDRDVARRQISQTQAINNPERHALTSFLGLDQLVAIDASQEPRPLQPGDRILVCSDGLSKVVDEQQIIAGLGGDPQRAAELLLKQVLLQQVPEQDNVTILVIACEGEEDTIPDNVVSSKLSASESPVPAGAPPSEATSPAVEAMHSARTSPEANRRSIFEDQELRDGPPAPRRRRPARPWTPSTRLVIPALAIVLFILVLLLSQLACPGQGGSTGSPAGGVAAGGSAPDGAAPTGPEEREATDDAEGRESSQDAPRKKTK